MKTDIDFFEELLRIPSVSSDIPQVNRAMDFMRNYLEKHGVACVMEQYGDRKVLFASTQPGKTQDYLLNAHLDVVPADAHLFEPHLEDGIMFGRGTDDCKGAAVAIAQILCALNGKASVGAIFTGDEEIGGLTTKHMVDLGYGARKLILVIDAAAYAIVTKEKGVLDLRLKARGKGVHSSRPWEGVNAIDVLLDGYAKLRAAWPKYTPDEESGNWFDTMSATIVNAGTAHNKVPDTAEMLLNIRYTTPGDESRIESFVRQTTGLGVVREETCVPVFCDTGDREIKALHRTMCEKWPDKHIPFCTMCGATDARHFAETGTPIALIGIDGAECHTDAEWCSVDDIAEQAEMLISFITRGE